VCRYQWKPTGVCQAGWSWLHSDSWTGKWAACKCRRHCAPDWMAARRNHRVQWSRVECANCSLCKIVLFKLNLVKMRRYGKLLSRCSRLASEISCCAENVAYLWLIYPSCFSGVELTENQVIEMCLYPSTFAHKNVFCATDN